MECVNKSSLSFKFDEVMTGELQHRWDGDKEPMEFTVTWGGPVHWLTKILCGGVQFPLRGRISAGRFAQDKPCKGTIELAYMEGRITYKIRFYGRVGDRFEDLRFIGSKTGIRPWNLHRNRVECHVLVGARVRGDPLVKLALPYIVLQISTEALV